MSFQQGAMEFARVQTPAQFDARISLLEDLARTTEVTVGVVGTVGVGVVVGPIVVGGISGTTVLTEVVDTVAEEAVATATGGAVPFLPLSPVDVLQDGGRAVLRRLWRASPPRIGNPADEIAGGFHPKDYVDDGLIPAGPYFGVDDAGRGVAEGFEPIYENGIQEIIIPGATFDDMMDDGILVVDGHYPGGVAVYAPTESLPRFNDGIQQGPPNIYHPSPNRR
ncbi:hypothetical protein SH467x_001961 [Pirellulaceae bacterium SH467]